MISKLFAIFDTAEPNCPPAPVTRILIACSSKFLAVNQGNQLQTCELFKPAITRMSPLYQNGIITAAPPKTSARPIELETPIKGINLCNTRIAPTPIKNGTKTFRNMTLALMRTNRAETTVDTTHTRGSEIETTTT